METTPIRSAQVSEMTTHHSTTDKMELAASVAPEDLRNGDFVTTLNEVFEYPSFLWCDLGQSAPDELIRVRCCSADGGTPLKIKAICLPFVFVKSPNGRSQTFDVRQVQLVRLQKRYAKIVWKELRKNRSKRKRKA